MVPQIHNIQYHDMLDQGLMLKHKPSNPPETITGFCLFLCVHTVPLPVTMTIHKDDNLYL